MHFHRTVHYALWVPAAAMLVCWILALAFKNTSLSGPFLGVLSIVVILAVFVELIAMPASLWLLLTDPEYRTARSIWLTMAALSPVLLAMLMGATVLYGHG